MPLKRDYSDIILIFFNPSNLFLDLDINLSIDDDDKCFIRFAPFFFFNNHNRI